MSILKHLPANFLWAALLNIALLIGVIWVFELGWFYYYSDNWDKIEQSKRTQQAPPKNKYLILDSAGKMTTQMRRRLSDVTVEKLTITPASSADKQRAVTNPALFVADVVLNMRGTPAALAKAGGELMDDQRWILIDRSMELHKDEGGEYVLKLHLLSVS